MKREDCFNFVREKVIAKCGEFEIVEEQIKYLRFVLKEKKNNPPEIDENVGLKPSFKEYIQEEIDYRKSLLETSDKQTPGIVKMNGKISEVVRIFEAMKDVGIISTNVEASQIGRIFFRETVDVKSFAAGYNARKKDLIEDERNTNSEFLEKFIDRLLEISFRGKWDILSRIVNHIGTLKNRIY
ncbi:MAG: hypothetical protein Q8N83_16195 [Ignavibacteria bacterium]|nr:hypothetical protein [Ignavibacteria bacterium]